MGALHEVNWKINLIIAKLDIKSTRERKRANELSLELKAMCQIWLKIQSQEELRMRRAISA